VAGAGFDAVIGRDFHDHGEQGGRRGVLTYTWLSLKRVLRYRAESWRLESTAGGFRGRALLVAFVNGRQYGGGAILAPRARLDDGRIEVVVFESAPTLEMIWNAPRLFLGTIEGYSRFRRLSVESAVLTGPPRFLHHRDGEPEGDEERLEVALRPRALPILVPRAVADDPTGPFRTERAP
jgi:diacylglycerol kinase family enzyme